MVNDGSMGAGVGLDSVGRECGERLAMDSGGAWVRMVIGMGTVATLAVALWRRIGDRRGSRRLIASQNTAKARSALVSAGGDGIDDPIVVVVFVRSPRRLGGVGRNRRV